MDPVILNYSSFSSDYIYAASLLTLLSVLNLWYVIYCLIKAIRMPLKHENKSISVLYLTLIGAFNLGKSYLGVPFYYFREFLQINKTITGILFNLAFSILFVIISRLAYYIIDLHLTMDDQIDLNRKRRILKISKLGLLSFCFFHLCCNITLTLWPNDSWMISNNYEKTIGLINFVFIMLIIGFYLGIILLLYIRISQIKGNSIALEIKASLRYKILNTLPLLFLYNFSVLANLFWDQLNSQEK